MTDDKLPTEAYSFVVEDAALDTDENHRVVKWSDPRDKTSIEGIRHADHKVTQVKELVQRQDISDWLSQKEKEVLDREHGKLSYKEEGTIRATFHILRKELVGKDSDLFHEKKEESS